MISNKTIFHFFGFTLLLLTFAHVSFAADYYVSPTGTASWENCGEATPLNGTSACSWQTAMSSATAGDVVYFRGGTYDLGIFSGNPSMAWTKMSPANSGTEGHPITFTAYPGEKPELTGTVTATSQQSWFGCGNGTNSKNYITWDGFSAQIKLNNIDPARNFETGLFHATGEYCTLRNSNFTGIDTGSWTHNTSFVRIQNGSSYAVIENNYFHDLRTSSIDAVNTGAIWIIGADVNHATIRNNTVVNCENGFLGKGGLSGREISTASIYNNFIYSSAGDYQGIYFNVNSYNGNSAQHRIYQNVIIGYKIGIVPTSSISGSTVCVYNNSIYSNNNNYDGIYVDGNLTGVEVYNNIVSNVTPLLRYYDGKVSFSDYNGFYTASGNIWNRNYATDYTLLSDWINSTGFDLYSITSDPLFASPGGSISSDYMLQVNSPYLGAGIDRQDYDNDGNTTERINMGAYITGNEVIGYVPVQIQDTTAPLRPKKLRIKLK